LASARPDRQTAEAINAAESFMLEEVEATTDYEKAVLLGRDVRTRRNES
jgi:hypothetical protein